MARYRDVIFLMGVALVFAIAVRIGVPERLGAHPWWAGRVVYLGVLVGLLPAAAVRLWAPRRRLWPTVTGLMLLLSVGATYFGKSRFVASFAKDALAGRMWFLGWIASVAFLFVLLAFALREKLDD